jgi:hypothetical protein
MGQARKSALPVIAAVALALTLAVLLTGCSVNLSCGNEEETTTTAAPTTASEVVTTTTSAGPVPTSVSPTDASTTTASSGTTTTEALSSAEERLPDGKIRAMGFIKEVWEQDGVRRISIDYAEFLTGEEANAAAVAAGEIAPGEDVPNDYFIRNVNTQLREFVVSGSVAITTSTRLAPHDGMGVPCTWTSFLSFWGGMGPVPEVDSHLKDMPWWIVRDGDTVITIDEQYLP